MPKLEQPNDKLKSGVAILTNEITTLQVSTPSMEVLIGGPYRGLDGEMHNYGHAALHVVTKAQERIYDFGRYGATTGEFGAEGEGILRIWDKFDPYIAGENRYGRATMGYSYLIPEDKALAIIKYYDGIVANASARRAKHPNQKEYKLSSPYHALSKNCATMTLDGARIGLPGIEAGQERFNEGRGLGSSEKMAARARNFGAWPSKIFMPADVQAMLEGNKTLRPRKITKYGALR